MSPEELNILREYCDDFKKFRDNTVDQNGNNLHDIKVSFDYVKNLANEYNLTGTAYGEGLINKVESANNVLSGLWNCLKDLELSITDFIESQEQANNSNYTQ